MMRRKTLEEMSAKANDTWGCPRCGCKDLRPTCVNTWYTPKGRRRQRVCRHCGQGVIQTVEIPLEEYEDLRNNGYNEDLD